MEIKLLAGQEGVIGDFVPSSRKAKGRTHFVSPVLQEMSRRDADQYWEAVTLGHERGPSRRRPNPALFFATDITLSASEVSSFAAKFEWRNAKPVAGSPHLAKVSRRFPAHFPVSIKSKRGQPVASLDIWVVESVINASEIPDKKVAIKPGGEWPVGGFAIQMGYQFHHVIKPKEIVTGPDRPDLSGRNASLLPPGTAYDGENLQLGVARKWDCSRVIRQKVINPNQIDLSVRPRANRTSFVDYPSVSVPDGHSKAGAISFQDSLIVGNDDVLGPGHDYADTNPYDRPSPRAYREDGIAVGGGSSPKGELRSYDTPFNALDNGMGSDGDRLEWRLHFLEFTRLEINGKWYLISKRFPWRVHTRFVKKGGKWQDDGSEKARNNDNF